MIIGVPKEIKDNENRVSTTPGGVHEYVSRGHQVIVETAAGAGSGFRDDEYRAAGAEIVDTHDEVFARAEMVAKVIDANERSRWPYGCSHWCVLP